MANIFPFIMACKYKNYQVFVDKESITSLGTKRIIHDFPNSGLRYAEPQGQVPKEFELEIVFSGATYQNDFEEFQALLEDPNPGTLILPTFGVVNNVVALPSASVHEYSDLGAISMTVKFTVTVQQPSPTSMQPTQEDVFSAGNNGIGGLLSKLTFGLVTPSTLNNIATLRRDITTAINTITQVVGFTKIAAGFITQLTVNISNPAKIADLLLGTGGFLNYVYQNFSSPNAFRDYSNLASVGNNLPTNLYEINQNIVMPQTPLAAGETQDLSIPLFPYITNEQIERNNNRLWIINTIRLWALIMMMEQASITTFTTTQDIINARNTIDALFNQIIEEDTTRILIPQMKQLMESIQSSTHSVLNSDFNTAFNVSTINLEKVESVAVLAYELYGELINNEADLLNYKNILIKLNPSLPAHAFYGIVSVVNV